MPRQCPEMRCQVSFFSTEQGGRRYSPSLEDAIYRPHIALSHPADTMQHLGATFRDGPGWMEWNQPVDATLFLCFWPDEQYLGLEPGSIFWVYEGSRCVGEGLALEWKVVPDTED